MRFYYSLFVLLFLPTFVLLRAEAQEPQKFRIIIAESINVDSADKETLFIDITMTVTEAIYRGFTHPVKSKKPLRFEVIGTPDVSAAAKRLGITLETEEDYFRIAEELKAELLLTSKCVGRLSKLWKAPIAGVEITIVDVALRIPVGLGLAIERAKKMPQSVERAVKIALRRSWEGLGITANVHQVVGDIVVLDRGVKDGIRVGNEFVVFREIDGKRVKIGSTRIMKAFASDAEAEIITGTGVRPGDKVVRLAVPSYFLDYPLGTKNVTSR